MALTNVASALLMGVVLLVVGAVVLRSRDWRQASPDAVGVSVGSVDRTLRSPATWTVTFLLLVFVLVGGAVVFVGGAEVPGVDQAALQVALGAISAVLLVSYLVAGIYYSARGRGLSSAEAVGLGAVALGLLFLSAVVANLFLGA